MIRKQERDTCKVNGDIHALATARKKLKSVQITTAKYASMAPEGMAAATAAKACRAWAMKSHILEEILEDRDLDRRTEFGVNRDSLPEHTAHDERTNEDSTAGEFNDDMEDAGGIVLEDKDDATSTEWTIREEGSNEPSLNPTNIWSQHAQHLREQTCFAKEIVPPAGRQRRPAS